MTVYQKYSKSIHWEWNKNRTLVLGGGAARGLVHIGIIKYLEENVLFPNEIIGTSIGAIIGAMFALGYSYQDMLEIAKQQKLKSLIDVNLKGGLIKGQKIAKLLEKIFGNKTFEDVKIPLKIIIFDLNSSQKKVIQHGKIWEAVRASISIPIIFNPYKYNGNWALDGGVVSNLSVEEASNKQILAVSTLPIESLKKGIKQTKFLRKIREKIANSLWGEVFYRTFQSIMKINQELSLLKKSDSKILLVNANPSWKYKYYDFLKIEEMTEYGYKNFIDFLKTSE